MVNHADNVREPMLLRSWTSLVLSLMLAVLAAAGVNTALPAAEGPWQRNDPSALRLITPYAVAPPEGEFWFGVEFELAPHWHVYWKNSGDAGYPPALDLTATPELTDVELLFPAPERYRLPGELLAFGYENRVIYPVRARIEAEGDVLEMTVNVDYVVCEVECIPFRYDLTLTQPLGGGPGDAVEEPVQAERLTEWRQAVPRPGPTLSAAIQADDNQSGRLALDLPFAARDLFFVPQDHFNLGEPSILPTPDGSRADMTLSRLDVGRPLPDSVQLEWTATAPPDSEAYPGQSGSLALTTPDAWRQAVGSSVAASSPPTAPAAGSLWWYWLPVVVGAALVLASGALKASPAVLRTVWIGGIFPVGGVWYLLSRSPADGTSLVSMPVVAMGAWVLILGSVIAFAGRSFDGPVPMALASAAATFSLLPAAPGIGWVGAALLVLAVIAARPQLETPSRLVLGSVGFLALLAVVARFYVLSGSVPPTPLAGIQMGLLGSAAGAWMAARGQRIWSQAVGWLLVAAGAACVLWFVDGG